MYRFASVTFEPGARTSWHTHPFAQRLIVTVSIILGMLSSGGVVESSLGFAVFERGLPGGSNAGFKIAAITSLSSGAPAGYGAVSTYAVDTPTYGSGTW